MTLAIVGVLWGLSTQGHASQAPLHLVQELADVVHLGAAAIWIGGLALTLVVIWRLPNAAARARSGDRDRRAGPILAGRADQRGGHRPHRHHPQLRRAVGADAAVVDDLRPVHPGQDRSAGCRGPGGPPQPAHHAHLRAPADGPPEALATVRNAAVAELAVALAILVVAALLVAEVPGRI